MSNLTSENIKAKFLDQNNLLAAYQEDINDTIMNANQTLGALNDILDLSGEDIENLQALIAMIPFPLQVTYAVDTSASVGENYIYYVDYARDTFIPYIGRYDAGLGTINKVADIFTVTADNTLDLAYDLGDKVINVASQSIPTIGGLVYSVSDTLGQANVLSRLTDLIASGRQDILPTFMASFSSVMSNATDGTKLLYEGIVDSLSKVQGSKIACFQILQTVYTAIGNLSTHTGGEYYSFDNTNYKIQSFAASNLVSALATGVATVAGALVSAISPILGMAVMMLPNIVGGVINSLNDINENSTAIFNPYSSNQLLNVPIWQGSISKTKNLWRLNSDGSLGGWLGTIIDKDGVAMVSVPGLVCIFWNNKNDTNSWNCEAYLSCSINRVVSSTISQTFSGYGGSSSTTDYNNGCNYFSFGLYTVSENGSTRNTMDEIYAINGVNADYNSATLLLARAALEFISKVAITNKFGYNTTVSDIRTAGYTDWLSIIDALNGMHVNPSSATWQGFVNTIIYGVIRQFDANMFYEYFLDPYFHSVTGLGDKVYVRNASGNYVQTYLHRDYATIFGGVPTRDDFFISAPKYSTKAYFNTIMIGVGIALATVAAVVTSVVVRVKIRNSQIKSYAKVAAASQNLQDNPDDPDALKAYIKAVKSYNLKSNLLGYSSRLNMIDGWQEAKSDSGKGELDLNSLYNNYMQSKSNGDTLATTTATKESTQEGFNSIKKLIIPLD